MIYNIFSMILIKLSIIHPWFSFIMSGFLVFFIPIQNVFLEKYFQAYLVSLLIKAHTSMIQ